MSEQADRTRAVKRGWAEPGSRHDALVRLLKVGLPSIVGVLLAVLVLAPLGKRGDVSFILDKKQAERAPERMRVESAQYTGADNKGQPFNINASRALQRSSNVPVVDVNGIFARMGLERGPVEIRAGNGRYNLDRQQLALVGPVKVAGNEGELLNTSNVLVDFNTRTLSNTTPVSGQMPVGSFSGTTLHGDLDRKQVNVGGGVNGQVKLGTFSANQMKADLDNRTVTLEGGARLKITQRAVR
ncbi:LPS export ABC transporter periplasmic protein LptC [Sphingomonas ginkgonis]|uniref:LPS export ABC transporter periplasmic protein LptC n=1 Tax=Sphingomonas ginkgonis TaxID=2315330 RepID=A0A3R9X6B7_9SPHN|nr:LPS export ABC transporter periplasmic protein LptC [Sphingomonas ginkgonis]RST29833.1 LPS export ABC transporter periplasmic protein LptC [Sphingomonas ginkgonis]